MDNNKKIVFNTAITYTQLVLSTVIGLFAVRYILQALGEEDYGIYLLVGGVVAMLNFLTLSMSSASTRFMAYSLGKGDADLSLRTFNTTLYIHLLLGIAVFVILEVGGWIMFEWMLNIPEGKVYDAQIVYQLMVLTTLISVVSVPYDAVITAHENLTFLSVVTVLYNAITLGIGVFLLSYDGNRLVLYGIAVVVNTLLSRVIKQIYSSKKYPECKARIRHYKDKGLFKKILSFTGWNLLTSIATIFSGQLRGVFINMFFGVKLNAGDGIAKRVNGQINQLSVGITHAITPQMTKSESRGNRRRLITLTQVGVKYTTFMFALIALPIAFEAHFILKVWLGTIPSYAVVFTQLIIISQFVSKLTWQISNAINSVGQIKVFRIVTSIFYLLSVVAMYIALVLGGSPEMVFVVDILTNVLLGIMYLYFGKKIVDINPLVYIKETTIPVVIPMIIAAGAVYPIIFLMDEGWLRLALFFISFVLLFTVMFLTIGTSKEEKTRLKGMMLKPIVNHKKKASKYNTL